MTVEAPEAQASASAAPAAAPAPAAVEQTPAQVAAQESEAEAGFEAGFKTARSDEPSAETRPEAAPAAPAPVVAAPQVKPVENPADKPIYAGLTEAQLKAALAKANEVDELRKQITATHDKAFGRMGEIQQALKDLQKSPTTGQPVKVTAASLKRLTEEYPELAEALADDLSAVLLAPAQATVDVAALEQSIAAKYDKKFEESARATEKKLLTIAHKDWPQIYASADFKEWQGTLPPKVRAETESSWDSSFLTDAFTAFKAWKANGKKEPADPAVAEQVAATKASEKRLAAAVVPKGAPVTAAGKSDDEAFAEGFKEARHRA